MRRGDRPVATGGRMHRDAIPDADPATLARPEGVAERIVAWLGARAGRSNVQRVVVQELEARP